jgi:glycosyltransferase involved in cell wall biosynthesis
MTSAMEKAAVTAKTRSQRSPPPRRPVDNFVLSEAAQRYHNLRDVISRSAVVLTFFVSCYNEQDYIVNTLNAICAAMERLNISYEIIVIDDMSTDASATLVENYIGDHPDLNIVLRKNKRNRGWAQNYLDCSFFAKGEYLRICCGDNSEPSESIYAIVSAIGRADMVIPYYAVHSDRSTLRRILSVTYTALVNLFSGNKLRYYNGLAVLRREDVMRWHSNATGFSFQAGILCRLLAQGRTYIEVPVTAIEVRGGASNALTLRNLISVVHLLIELLFRRILGTDYDPEVSVIVDRP